MEMKRRRGIGELFQVDIDITQSVAELGGGQKVPAPIQSPREDFHNQFFLSLLSNKSVVLYSSLEHIQVSEIWSFHLRDPMRVVYCGGGSD